MHAAIMDSFPIQCKSFYHYHGKMSIHAVIRSNRLRLNLTEQQLADRCDVSRPAVQQWEKEGGTAPKRAKQPLVAKVLGITLSELLETGLSESPPESAEAGIRGLSAAFQRLGAAQREQAAALVAGMARDPGGPWAGWLSELLTTKSDKALQNHTALPDGNAEIDKRRIPSQPGAQTSIFNLGEFGGDQDQKAKTPNVSQQFKRAQK